MDGGQATKEGDIIMYISNVSKKAQAYRFENPQRNSTMVYVINHPNLVVLCIALF